MAVVIIVGLIAPFWMKQLRPYRWVAGAYLAMVIVVVVVAGGKPYYMARRLAATIALGAGPMLSFLGARHIRTPVAVAVAVVLVIPNVVFALPVAPIGSPVFRAAVVVNPNQAEFVGGDTLIAPVREESAALDPTTSVVRARNYGEAGALSRAYRSLPRDALPRCSPATTPMPPGARPRR